MTAHVDFSALIAEGLDAGLRPVFLTTQAEFLASLGFHPMLASMRARDIPRPLMTANLRAMTELIKPDGLGKFRVLVQEKNSGITRSSDLLPNPERLPDLNAAAYDSQPPLLHASRSMNTLPNGIHRTIM